ncbi:MAG: SDR family NAD(P)-dependent oxidoreductase [Candidatus Puniceispirillaceae bacterium]
MANRQHYFITGVSSGIGLALTEQLVQAGHNVSGMARRGDRLATLSDRFDDFYAVTGDVTDEAQMTDAVKKAQAHHGAIDVFIPNAGLYIPSPANEIAVSDFAQHMAVNYMGVVNGLAAILPAMQATGRGHIALMASVAGYRGLPRSAAYGPTKAALINLGEALRFDLQGSGVKIQIICPGFVETEATAVNDFAMPDIISSEEAARQIIQGLGQDKFEIAFPKSFARKMKWLKWLPNDTYFNIVKKITR